MKGIDVSTIQGNINWAKVAADDVKFAMIKATQGRGEGAATRLLKRFTDSKFKKNIVEASNAGIACGVYHYLTAQTVEEAKTEASYFISVITPYKKHITLWAAVDVESVPYLSKLGKYELAKIVRAFMDEIRAAGYKPMLYTNPNYLTYRLPAGTFDNDEIWLAHYNVKKPMQVPNTQMWQYGTGKVNGVSGAVDMNEGYFNEALCAIAKLGVLEVIKTPEYWYNHYEDVEYLDLLLVRAANCIKEDSPEKVTFDVALDRLVKRGIINTPEYWKNNSGKVMYLPELICRLGGSV